MRGHFLFIYFFFGGGGGVLSEFYGFLLGFALSQFLTYI